MTQDLPIWRRPYFYPRSPCGERLAGDALADLRKWISIHALLAESDISQAATILGEAVISIHALLAESDMFWGLIWLYSCHFYPRSPCGERLAAGLRK